MPHVYHGSEIVSIWKSPPPTGEAQGGFFKSKRCSEAHFYPHVSVKTRFLKGRLFHRIKVQTNRIEHTIDFLAVGGHVVAVQGLIVMGPMLHLGKPSPEQ
jgi:hypothetical protein